MTALARAKPCRECPFRRDTEPGQFTSERYEALLDTVGHAGQERQLGEPLFACHKAPEGAEQVCAGWLAVCGAEHLSIRLAVVSGLIDGSLLSPAEDWPDLFDSYEEMAEAQGR